MEARKRSEIAAARRVWCMVVREVYSEEDVTEFYVLVAIMLASRDDLGVDKAGGTAESLHSKPAARLKP